MPRIRSIKPEYATDGKIRRLSDSTALFFLLLWNHCDDAGFFVWDAFELASKIPRWRSQEIGKFLFSLRVAGLVRCSRPMQRELDGSWRPVEPELDDSSQGVGGGLDGSWTGVRVGLVGGWSHQRIDKPRPSKWKDVEIPWDDALPTLESSGSVPRKDRRGKDRRGKEGIGSASAGASLAAARGGVSPPEEPVTNATWEAYSEAYLSRHKSEPVRNATVNGQLAQFVKRIGREEAPRVAAFYVSHNDSFYVRKGHPVGLLLQDAEKLRTEWATGTMITAAAARDVDRKQTNFNVFNKLIQEAREKENSNGQ